MFVEGNKIPEPTPPERENYTFEGWYRESACITLWDFDTDTVTEDITLYAKWVLKKYTITYNANGGIGAPSAQTKTHDSVLYLSGTTPTRDGYDFKGWAVSNTATSPNYQPSSIYTDNADITLYAVWEGRNCTITFDSNGGSEVSN